MAQTASEPAQTFRSGVNLVLVPVVVRDSQGHPVGDLTRNDFQIFDQGKRQTIASFSAIKRTGGTHRSESETISPAPSRGAASVPGQLQSAAPARASAKPQRFIVYLFDDLGISSTRMAHARSALIGAFRSLPPTDRAAIETFSGTPQIDFTSDREKLDDTVAKLRSRFDPSTTGAQVCPNINYYIADLIRNRGDQQARQAAVAHTIQCAHVKPLAADGIVTGAVQRQLLMAPLQSTTALRALRIAIERLARMPGERLIVLVSPGFFSQSSEALSDTQEVLRLAAQAHVTIGSLNAHGLYIAEPDASLTGEANMAWWKLERESINAEEGIMRELAQGSGGRYIGNTDLRTGFGRLTELPEFSYILGFEPADRKQDGKFHRIKIRVPGGRGLTIVARRGYYAFKQDPKAEALRLAVEDAVYSRGQKNEIPVVLQTGYSKPDKGDPTVLVAAKVSLKPLHFRTAKGRNTDSLIAVAALFNSDGGYVAGTRKTVDLQLRNETLAEPDPSVTLRFRFPVKRGAYEIRLVVRDSQSGAMTTFTRPEIIR